MSERVSVVIPSWNGLKWLGPCLASLRVQTYRDFKVIVVDNGSVDGTIAFLRSTFPEVEIVALAHNTGFASGMNAGIRAAKGELVAALNNDTEAHPDWLARMVAAADSHPEYAIFASQIMNFGSRDVFDSIGDGYRRCGIAFNLATERRDDGSLDKPFEVFGACAAACAYRRAMLDDIGLFDDDFFAYMEDVDLCVRARLAGYRSLAVPGALVYHVGSASNGGGASPFAIRLTARNIPLVIVKNIPGQLLPKVIAETLAAQVVLLAEALFTNRRPWLRRSLGAYFRGVGASFRAFPTAYAKRKENLKRHRISAGNFAEQVNQSELQRRAFMARFPLA